VPTRILKKGVRGDDVKWLQQKLSERGYPVGTIDGIYGTKTEQCVKQLQMDAFVDGIVGKLTIEKLKL
jgi:peptidoglycan hydrolase-like protein with peptidoglycan-binding domain